MGETDLLAKLTRRAIEQSPEPLATAEQLAAAEQRIGFTLPDLLRAVLTRVGNGGFGPGYALLGTGGGATDDRDMTADQLYLSFRSHGLDDGGRQWPERLYPLCYWGCGIYSCVDCISPEVQVIRFDPNHYSGEGSYQQCLAPEGYTLQQWLFSWAAGDSLFE